MIEFTLREELTAKLKDVCRRERVTLFSLLLSAFKRTYLPVFGANRPCNRLAGCKQDTGQ